LKQPCFLATQSGHRFVYDVATHEENIAHIAVYSSQRAVVVVNRFGRGGIYSRYFFEQNRFFLSFLSLTSLFSVIMMIISSFLYPKVTKLAIFSFIIGIFDIICGIFVGLFSVPLYFLSACCLFLAGAMMCYEYRLN